MAQTFTAEVDFVANEVGTDGLLALYNNETASASMARTFTLRRLTMLPLLQVSDTVGTPGRLTLSRITAASGGTARTATAFNTSSTALPAQVEFRTLPTAITAGAALRGYPDTRTYGDTLAMPAYQSAMPSFMDAPGNVVADWTQVYSRGRDTSVEPIVLREGQGVAMLQATVGMPMSQSVDLTVRNLTTGACYVYTASALSSVAAGSAIWSFLNGAGSGAVLEVSIVSMPETGTTNVIPEWRLLLIDAALGGEAVTPIAHDTSNSVPSACVVRKGPFVTQPAGTKTGSGYDINKFATAAPSGLTLAAQQRFGATCTKTWTPIVQVTTPPQYRFGRSEVVLWDSYQAGDQAIVLRPGQGVAVAFGRNGVVNNSCLMPMSLQAEFTHEPPPSGGASETAFTFVGV